MGRITITSMDCNDAVDQARQFLFPPAQAGSTLGLAVIDPTAFQMRFDSIERLTRGLRLDLLVVFMSDFIRRFFGTPAFERTMDSFYGIRTWRRFIDMRASGLRVPYRDLLDLYEQQLRGIGYTQVDDSVRILKSTGSTLYHLVFASKHPRGGDFFEKISQRTYDGKRRLL